MKKITAILMALTISGLLLFATGNAIASATDIKINEIMFDPMGDDAGNEWIELYNNGTEAQNVNGWTISNRDGTTDATLPDWDFPNDTYLVVHFGTGTNDNDFSDGNGSFYTGINVEVFNNLEDECALYNGTPSALNITDFVSWAEDTYVGGVGHNYAVSAGIWDSGDFFGLLPIQPFLMTFPIIHGDTIGRDKDSTDTNQPEDWDGHGGVDAQGPTSGARNIHSITISPPLPPPHQPHKNWTVMVYMDGNGNLEIPWINDINKMELAGSDGNVNIVVQINLLRIFDGKMYRSYIQQDNNLNHWGSAKITVEPKPDIGAPETLTDFINWATINFPADHYALFIAGHGQGWKGTLISKEEGRGLRMGELSAALGPAPLLDTVVFYSCLMGMTEVAYQINADAMTMVASEEITYAVFPFDTFLTSLKQNPTWDEETFAKQAAVQFDAALATYGIEARTTSAVRLDAPFLDLVAKVSAFADDMFAETAQTEWGLEDYDFRFIEHHNPNDNVQINVKNDRLATESYYDSSFVDLYDFMDHVDADGSIPPEYKDQASLIKAKLIKDAGVIMEEKHGPKHPRSHGLSIYFPIDQSISKYAFDKPWPSRLDGAFSSLAIYAEDKTTEWGKVPDDHPYPETPNFDFRDKQWDEFLHRYYKPVADAGEDKTVNVGVVVHFDGSGSSDSDGTVKKWCWDFDSNVNSDNGDWDKDGTDETNDDKETEGKNADKVFNVPGVYTVTLTVWDDHNLQPQHNDHWKTDQDTVIITVCTTPTVESSDYSGSRKDTFLEDEDVHAYGSNYSANKEYDLYIVDDRTWTDGMAIPPYRVNKTVTTDANGKITPHPTLIWSSAETEIGKYDIVVDVNGNGTYDKCIDALDDMDVGDAGFEVVPEFTTIAIPVAAILGLLFLFSRKKRKE